MRQTIPNGPVNGVPDSQNAAIFQLKDANLMGNAQPVIREALENPNAVWYVQVVDGQRFGPAPTPVIKEWVEQKRISPTMLVWCEGMPEWLPAATVFPELSAMFESSEMAPQDMPEFVSVPKPATLQAVSSTIRQPKPPQPASAPKPREMDGKMNEDDDEDDGYPDIEQNRIRMVDDKKTKYIIIAIMIVVLAALAFLSISMFSGHGGVH